MPRTARASSGGTIYHAMSRGNRGERVFHSPEDYDAFEVLIGRACGHVRMRVIAYCVMPNHVHFVLWPRADGDLGSFMHRLLTAHVVRHARCHGTTGRIWQGRFKAFPVQDDDHLITLMRYVERNPVRAGLVPRAEDWRWSSAAWWIADGLRPAWGDGGPHGRPADWLNQVALPHGEVEQEALRRCMARGRPWGAPEWVRRTAAELGLESSLRPPGRPPSRSLSRPPEP